MSSYLTELMDKPEVLVESAIKKLEYLTGWQSTDVRLLAEIDNQVRTKTAQLGLDPNDTTGPELYHALLVKLAADTEKLKFNHDEVIAKLAKIYKPYKVYTLKHSVVKNLLRQSPPRKLMKQLNYRSVDSMLKRENVCELIAGTGYLESPNWVKNFWKRIGRLSSSDFEPHKIEFVKMPAKRWSMFSCSEITNDPLLGAIYIWPGGTSPFSLSVHFYQNVNKLRTACALIKLRQVENDFGKKLVAVLQGKAQAPLEIAHLPIDWQTIFQHYGKRSKNQHTEFFGPHLLHEDLSLVKSLSKVSPVFGWWQDLEHVAKRTKNGLVSLNLTDVLDNNCKPFAKRNVSNVNHAIWHKLVNNYLEHPSVEQYIMSQIEPRGGTLEKLSRAQVQENEIKQFVGVGA